MPTSVVRQHIRDLKRMIADAQDDGRFLDAARLSNELEALAVADGVYY